MKVSVVDYNIGNIKSVVKALKYLGADVRLAANANDIKTSEKLILPGVSAFGAAMDNLKKLELIQDYIKSGKWFLGICVGLQLLFETSEESPNSQGLKIIPGIVKKMDDTKLIVPHIGWNTIKILKPSIFFKGLSVNENLYFYFVHSYYVCPNDKNVIIAATNYGSDFCSAVEYNNVIATQFHPEKSQNNGLQCLKNFLEL